MIAFLWLLAVCWVAAAGVNAAAKNWENAIFFGVFGVLTLFVLWIIDRVTEPSASGQAGQPAGHNPRPQAGLSPYSSEFDREVNRAMERQEERNGGRNRGGDITVRVSKGRDWGTWRAGAHIWEQAQKDNSNGVYVEFDDPGDQPTYNDFGALVPRGSREE